MHSEPDEIIKETIEILNETELEVVWKYKRAKFITIFKIILQICIYLRINFKSVYFLSLVFVDVLGIVGLKKLNKFYPVIYFIIIVLLNVLKLPLLNQIGIVSGRYYFYPIETCISFSNSITYQKGLLLLSYCFLYVFELFQMYFLILFMIKSFKLESEVKGKVKEILNEVKIFYLL